MDALVISYGAYFAIHGKMTAGALIAIVLVSSRIMQPIQRGLLLWVQYQDFMIAKDKVERIFTKPLVKVRQGDRQPANTGHLETHRPELPLQR